MANEVPIPGYNNLSACFTILVISGNNIPTQFYPYHRHDKTIHGTGVRFKAAKVALTGLLPFPPATSSGSADGRLHIFLSSAITHGTALSTARLKLQTASQAATCSCLQRGNEFIQGESTYFYRSLFRSNIHVSQISWKWNLVSFWVFLSVSRPGMKKRSRGQSSGGLPTPRS